MIAFNSNDEQKPTQTYREILLLLRNIWNEVTLLWNPLLQEIH